MTEATRPKAAPRQQAQATTAADLSGAISDLLAALCAAQWLVITKRQPAASLGDR